MSRLPTVGSDNNSWGEVLNDYLEVSHNADGTIKKASIESSLTGDVTSHTHSFLSGSSTASVLTWDGSSILFTSLNGIYSRQNVSSNLTLTVNNLGAISDATTVLELKGDGTHSLTLSGFNNGDGSDFDNTLNTVNVILCGYIGGNYIYSILTTYIDNSVAPTYQSATITNSDKKKIILVTNLLLDSSSVPEISDFEITQNGTSKLLSSIVISGKNVEINATTNFTGGTVVVLNYIAGINPIRAGVGRNLSNQSNKSITNNVSDPVTLNAPASFQATPVSNSQINLSWTIVPNAINYEIWFSLDDIMFNLLTSPSQSVNTYSHSGLPLATQVWYYIKSIGDVINYTTSLDSASITATTNSASTLSTVTLNTPTITSNTSLNITWTDIANESGYQLQRSTDNATWANIGTQLASGVVSFDNTTCTLGQVYYYRIQAIGIGAYTNSAWSSSVNKTINSLTFTSAITAINGAYLDITYNKDVLSGTSGITLYVGGVSKTFTYSVVSNKLRITPTVPFLVSDVITLSYSSGNVIATDSTTLADFTGVNVTNAIADGIDLTFSTLNNITKNGTVYTGATTGFANQYGLADESFAGDVAITWEIVNESTDHDVIMGFRDESANTPYNGASGGYNYFGWYARSSTSYFRGYSGANTATLNIAALSGDILRLRRTGTTVYLEYKRSGSWNILYTYSVASTGTLYVTMNIGAGAYRCINPKYYI